MSTKSPSPPTSPRISSSRLSLYNITQAFIRAQRIKKSKTIVSSSGPTPITHPTLSQAVGYSKLPVSHEDEFICSNGVDVPKLLRATRSTLLEKAQILGAHILVEERWEVSIIHLKDPKTGPFRVKTKYSANATRSEKPDPHHLVVQDQAMAISVPGLMTINKRIP